MTDVTYPPLDVPKPVADGVWVVDSGPLHLAGAPLPVRMTVLRLADGSLLLHSPTNHTAAVQAALEQIGPIAHLVAPNTAHWSYMQDWQRHLPGATYWAVPGLRKRPAVVRSGLRIDRDLPDGEPDEWGGTMQSVLVRGLGVVEAALFHVSSRTLVLTDLIVNVEKSKLPWPLSLGAQLVGSVSPHGRAPIYLRAAIKSGGKEATDAGKRIVALEPQRVIFAHGDWFATDAPQQLADRLSWLTR